MCKKGNYLKVKVKIPVDLACPVKLKVHGGKPYWKFEKIDACIAPIVRALQKAGIDMRGSCCGHGKRFGSIHLQDGRWLIIMNNKQVIEKKILEERFR